MKRKVSSMWRSATALLLALSLAFGTCGTAMAADPAEGETAVTDYVVIGDSMTNGYCLPGYYPQNTSDDGNVRGYKVEVPGTYPVLFEQYLENLDGDATNDNVKLHQLSISGIRAEELHFLLNPQYAGDAYTDRVFNADTDGENWFNKVFRQRDDYSREDVVTWGNDKLRAEYAEAIANAEIISLNIGTNNFGTFLTGELMDIVLGGTYEYNLNDVLSQITDNAEILTSVENLRGELTTILNEQVDPAMSDMANKLVDMFLYAYAGFAVNYTASVETIRTINPSAQIIVMGLLNNMDGMTLKVGENTVYLNNMYGAVIKAANLYMAGLDVVNQVVNGTPAAIYVDVQDVELIVDQIAAINPDAAFDVVNDILEWKMISTLTGNVEDYLAPAARTASVKVTWADIKDDVDLQASVDNGRLAEDLAAAANKAAVEKAIGALTGNILSDLADEDIVKGVLTCTEPAHSNCACPKLKIEVELSGVKAETVSIGKMGTPTIGTLMSIQDIPDSALTPAVTGYDFLEPMLVKELYLGIREAIIFSAGNPVMNGDAVYALVAEGLGAVMGKVTGPIMAAVQRMMAGDENVVIHDEIANALTADAGITSFLYVYARFMVAEGMGIHPNLTGHSQMYNQLVAAWEASVNTEDYIEDEVNTALADLYAWVQAHGPEVLDAAWAYAEENGYIDMVQAKIDEVKAAVDAYVAEVRPQLENAIAELKTELAEIEAKIDAEIAKLEAAVEELEAEVREEIEAKITELEAAKAVVEAKIAELEQKLEEIQAKVGELIGAVDGLDAAVDNLIDVVTGAAEGAVDEALDQVQAALDRIAAAVAVAEGVVDKINAAIDEAQALVGEAEAAIDTFVVEVKETVAEIKAAAEQAVADAKDKFIEIVEEAKGNLIAAAQAALEELKDMAIAAAEDLLGMAQAELEAQVDAAIAALNDAVYGATHGEYTVTKGSYYVSLGDSSVTGFGLKGYSNYGYQVKVPESFPYKLAEAIGLDVDSQFVQLGQGGLRVEDIRYILDENYVPDEYTLKRTMGEFDEFGGGLENYRKIYAEEIAKADLITIGYGNNNFTTFVTAQLGRIAENKYPYAMDWSRYFGAEGVAYVEEALAEVTAYFIESGLDATLADMLTLVVECYAYAYVGFAFNYTEVLNNIHEINPDALVIVVGAYNPIDEMVIDIEGEQIALGEMVDALIELTNVHFTAYSILTPNTTFVEAPDVETFFDADVAAGEYAVVNTQTYLMAMYNDSGKAMHANANGHEYIKEQILGALSLTYATLLGDVNLDGKVNNTDVNLLYRYMMKRLPAESFNELQLVAADVNEDSKVNNTDMNLLYRYVLKRISSLGAAN